MASTLSVAPSRQAPTFNVPLATAGSGSLSVSSTTATAAAAASVSAVAPATRGSDWIRDSSIRAYVFEDPILDWFELYGHRHGFRTDLEGYQYDPNLEFMTFIAGKNRLYFAHVQKAIGERLATHIRLHKEEHAHPHHNGDVPNSLEGSKGRPKDSPLCWCASVAAMPSPLVRILENASDSEAENVDKHAQTVAAMRAGVPCIVNACLHNTANRTICTPQLLVRSDMVHVLVDDFQSLLPHNAFTHGAHLLAPPRAFASTSPHTSSSASASASALSVSLMEPKDGSNRAVLTKSGSAGSGSGRSDMDTSTDERFTNSNSALRSATPGLSRQEQGNRQAEDVRRSGAFHYVVVMPRFTTLTFNVNGSQLRNVRSFKFYKALVLLQTCAVALVQGYQPREAYILGRGWTCGTGRGDNALDTFAIVPTSSSDWKTGPAQAVDKALRWLRRLRSAEGAAWTVLPRPSIPELYPNAKNSSCYPWSNAKKRVAQELREITLLWYVSPRHRRRCHAQGVFTFDDPRISVEMIGIRGPIISKVLADIIAINQQCSIALPFGVWPIVAPVIDSSFTGPPPQPPPLNTPQAVPATSAVTVSGTRALSVVTANDHGANVFSNNQRNIAGLDGASYNHECKSEPSHESASPVQSRRSAFIVASTLPNVHPRQIRSNRFKWRESRLRLGPGRRGVEFFVDFETGSSISDPLTNFPFICDTTIIALIGCGFIHPTDETWVCRIFAVEAMTKPEEKRIINEWLAYMRDIMRQFAHTPAPADGNGETNDIESDKKAAAAAESKTDAKAPHSNMTTTTTNATAAGDNRIATAIAISRSNNTATTVDVGGSADSKRTHDPQNTSITAHGPHSVSNSAHSAGSRPSGKDEKKDMGANASIVGLCANHDRQSDCDDVALAATASTRAKTRSNTPKRTVTAEREQKIDERPRVWHWSRAELAFLETNYNSAVERHGADGTAWVAQVKWLDLLTIVKSEPVVVRGALNFSLKSVAKALHKLGHVEHTWPDSQISDGMSAMIGLFRCAELARIQRTSMQAIPLMNDIVAYLRLDVKSMQQILAFLRKR